MPMAFFQKVKQGIWQKILDGAGQSLLYKNLYYRGDCSRFGMEIERAHLG
tara:strand:+ start:461 stop:610 length:150 start_codon:yes stop_codon:yes gene_type:complete